MKFNKDVTYVFAMGGLGEIGKNTYCMMRNDELIITDAGVYFPGDELMGINYVIPDFSFLKENESKIKGLFITHGHEDHIGAIPFLVTMVNIPAIYAPHQAAALIRKKLEDRGIKYNNVYAYDDDSVYKFKEFQVEFYRVTHSIPDAHGIIIKSKDGTIMTTGDFKFDLTPIGPLPELHKIAKLGAEGVTLLMNDSTNAMNKGTSNSESLVNNALEQIFTKNPDRRIIIATFASNIYRLKHIVDTCKRHGRKIVTFGRSMENNIEISIEGGYIKHKEVFITPEEAKRMAPEKVCILCTGTQGEPLAALSRIANGTFRQIKLTPDDIVIFSSSAIPGNALSIGRTINKLYLKGVTVYTNSDLKEIHASGHANEEELKWLFQLARPKYLMPFHGEYRMLKASADIAVKCGMPRENAFVLSNGDVLAMKDQVIKYAGHIHIGNNYVDGNRVGDVSNSVMKERKTMANDGIVVVIANIDVKNKKLIGTPNVTTRGFVLVNDNIQLLKKLEGMAKWAINDKLKTDADYADIKNEIISTISSYISTHTGRRTIILPVIMDIKKSVKS